MAHIKRFLPQHLIRVVFAAVSILISIYASAQTPLAPPDPAKINIPTSPEADMIKRFGDVPVGYYTGTANISIPIYTISEGGVSIPITLSYHSSGIKVEDQATWVGLGWDLSPEGQIIQEVRGKNDDVDFYNVCQGSLDYPKFLQRFTLIEDYMSLNQYGRVNAPNTCGNYLDKPYPWNGNYQDPYCVIDQLLHGIGQPDIYNYNFGPYSGKFYIHPATHAVIMLDKKEGVVFERFADTAIKATTPDGVVYNFATRELADGGAVNLEYTGKTYKLTNITFLNGKTIGFTYVDEHYTEDKKTEWADAMGTETLGLQFSNVTQTHNKKTLSRITTTDTYVDFITSTRDDINKPSTTDNVKKLSSVEVTARLSNKKIKRFDFTYSYFGTYDYLDKRLKLDKVQEIGFTDAGVAVTNVPPTLFNYDMSVTLPPKNSYAVDFWGYYNGAANNTRVPDLSYFDYLYKDEYSTINLEKKYSYTGANRFTNNATAGACLLNKITYPTGGYTEFGYEPNSFTNQFIPDMSQPFSKNVYLQDNSISGSSSKTGTFKLSRSTTIHFANSINNGKGNYNNVPPLTYSQMQGCYIKFSKFTFVNGTPTLTLIKQWDLSTVLNADFIANGGKIWSEDVRVEFDSANIKDPYFNYQVTVEFPDNLNNVNYAAIAGVVSNYTYYDEVGVDMSESHQGGMRIKTIKNYTQSGTLASDKLIKYYEGKLLNKFRPMSVYKVNKLDNTVVSNGVGTEYIGFLKKMTVPDRDFGTGGGNLIGYGKVEELELTAGTSQNGKKVFNYFNAENKTRQDCPNIPNTMNGELTIEQVFDASNNIVSEKINSYQFLSPLPAKFMCMNIVKVAIGSKVPCFEENMPNPPYTSQYYDNLGAPYPTTLYQYNAYTLQSEYHKLSGVTNKLYSNGNIFTSSESYTYNSDGILAGVTSINSKGETTAANYTYTNSTLAASDAGYNFMLSKNMIGVPVIVENFVGGVNTAGQKTAYGGFSGLTGYWPKYTYTHTKTNPWDLVATIDSYDDKANVTQYTGRNGIPIAIVWNADKTLPVAKVENSTYAALQALPGGLAADFRTALPNARVTSFSYKPLIGVNTVTDVNNRTQTYEYDEFNRLNLVRDQDNKILKKLCYNYMGQAIQCAGSPPPSGCSPVTNSVVISSNPPNVSNYQVVFTNYNNPALVYTFPIPNGTQTFGCIPKAKYYVNISKSSGLESLLVITCNGSTQSGTSATFIIDLSVGTTDANISIDYDL